MAKKEKAKARGARRVRKAPRPRALPGPGETPQPPSPVQEATSIELLPEQSDPDIELAPFFAHARRVQGNILDSLAQAEFISDRRWIRTNMAVSPEWRSSLLAEGADFANALGASFSLQVATLYRDELDGVIADLLRLLSEGALLSLCERRPAIVFATPSSHGDDPTWFAVREAVSAVLGRNAIDRYVKLQSSEETREARIEVAYRHEEEEFCFSIRVRSIFDDVQAEVAGQLTRAPKSTPSSSVHLPVLARDMDNAYASAQQVRAESNPETGAPNVITASLDRDATQEVAYVKRICQKAKISVDLIARIELALNQKARLGPTPTSRLTEVRPPQVEFRPIARELEVLQELIAPTGLDNASPALAQAWFLIRLEEAVCRVLMSERSERQSAFALYSELEDGFSDRPTLWFRLAQTYARAASEAEPESRESRDAVKRSGEAYARAASTLDAAIALSPAARELLLSAGQTKYLLENVARLHSFVLWRHTDRLKEAKAPVTFAMIDLICEAYKIVDAEIQRKRVGPEVLAKLANNAVSYGAHAIETLVELDVELFDPKVPRPEDLLPHIAILLESEAAKDPRALQVWDSIGHARRVTRDKAGALEAALQFVKFHTEVEGMPDAQPRSAYERSALRRALNRALQSIQDGA